MDFKSIDSNEKLGDVLFKAARDPSFTLIFIGFFSCGYQLAFITSHFPALVSEMCGAIAPNGLLHGLGITTTSALGAVSISVIGVAKHRRHHMCRLARQTLLAKANSRYDIHRAHDCGRSIHRVSDNPNKRSSVSHLLWARCGWPPFH